MIKLIKSSKYINLDKRSIYLRKLILMCLQSEKRGHVGSAMSLVEIIRVLYDKYIKKGKSKFILSKGHGCLALYALLYDKGYIKKKDLISVGKFDSILGGHPEHEKINGVEVSTGALGHGLPIAVGMAIGGKLKKKHTKYFVVCGDGEINEGSVWEALLSASKHKLDNLILLIDYNKLQSYGHVKEILDLEPLVKKFNSFGFNTLEVNGHDVNQINNAILRANKKKNKPSVIICHTVKGKGIKIAENNPFWHHKSLLTDKDLKDIERSLGK
jgi:transketolase